MTTRAAVGVLTGSSFTGSPVGRDGYPDAVGPQLSAMIGRDGAALAAETLTGRDWHALDAQLPPLTPQVEATARSAGLFSRDPARLWARTFADSPFGPLDGVPGYGVAEQVPEPQLALDLTRSDPAWVDAEWVYGIALTSQELVVWFGDILGHRYVLAARLPLTALPGDIDSWNRVREQGLARRS